MTTTGLIELKLNCIVYFFLFFDISASLIWHILVAVMFEAEITSEGSGHVVCQRCRNSYAPGTQLHYMGNINHTQPGRHLCRDCYDHYMKKSTTQRRSERMPATLPSETVLYLLLHLLVPASGPSMIGGAGTFLKQDSGKGSGNQTSSQRHVSGVAQVHGE